MKAVAKTGDRVGFEYIDVPKPAPGPKEVLIEVEAAAICGSDIHFYNWNQWAKDCMVRYNISFPFVAGHECCGTIVDVGSEVSKERIGQRVAIETHIPCGKCFQCQTGNAHNCMNLRIYGSSCNGCYAPYTTVDESVAFEIPDELTFEEGAILEPAGVAMSALEKAAVQPGDTVVVNGCGPIGLFCIQLLNVCGAARVIGIDMDDYRLGLAKKLGAITIDAKTQNAVEIVQEMTKKRGGADALIEFTAAASVYNTIFDMIRLEGRLVTVGHVSSVNDINVAKNFNMKGITIRGSFGRGIWGTWWKLTSLIEAKKINILDVVTHRYSFSQFDEAFQQTKKGSGKILFIKDK